MRTKYTTLGVCTYIFPYLYVFDTLVCFLPAQPVGLPVLTELFLHAPISHYSSNGLSFKWGET